jgi:PE-PPE domain
MPGAGAEQDATYLASPGTTALIPKHHKYLNALAQGHHVWKVEMTGRGFRWSGVALLAIAGVTALGLTSMLTSGLMVGPRTVVAEAALMDDASEIMGGSGLPIPPPSYVESVNGLYIDPTMPFPGQPVFPGFTPQALFTPEGLYPVTGIQTLTADESISQGVTILNNTITPQIDAGNPSLVFGFSQSSAISSLEMEQLDPSGTPSDLPVSFVLTGDPMNPNGGLLERFDGLSFPSLGQTFYGATPADDFPTSIYTLEYDGFADFPQYPIDLPADLNAVLGIAFVHGTYSSLTPAEVATAEPLTTEGSTLTQYFIIPTENLPLLDPLRAVPVVGNPLADLIQPDLKVIVNLGYGADDLGYSTPANVPTPFGLFPDVNLSTLSSELASGAQQGVTAFENDLSDLSLSSLLPSVTAVEPAALPTLPEIVNAISSAASSAYSTLLPTADIINSLLTSVPAYDVSLFTENLQTGDLLDALGLPIAADMGLGSLAAGFEVEVISNALSAIEADFSGLF